MAWGVADAISGLIVFDVTAVEMAAEPCVFLVAGQGDRNPGHLVAPYVVGDGDENDEGRSGRCRRRGPRQRSPSTAARWVHSCPSYPGAGHSPGWETVVT